MTCMHSAQHLENEELQLLKEPETVCMPHSQSAVDKL